MNLSPGIRTPDELSEWMIENIEYGYVYKGKVYRSIDDHFLSHYRLQDPDTTQTYGVGVCWDQVEFERRHFREFDMEFHTVYIVNHISDDNRPSHTFLVYRSEKRNKWVWFENSFAPVRGLHHGFRSVQDATRAVKRAMVDFSGEPEKGIFLYSVYEKPDYGLTPTEFMRFCELQHDINEI